MGLIAHVSRFDKEVNALRLARHKRHTEARLQETQ